MGRATTRWARREPRRAILFVDDQLWHCFNQLAAALRRDGFDAIRVVSGTVRRGRMIRFVERCIYSEVVDMSVACGMARLRQLADSERVADVQINEETFAALGFDSEPARLFSRLSGIPAERRVGLIDKRALAVRFATLGIPVPEQYPATSTTAAEAVAQLGFPLVVKGAIGTGGCQVHIVGDRVALDVAVAELSDASCEVIFQRHVTGELVGYGAVRSTCGVVAEFVGRESKGRRNPLGPSVGVVTIDDEEAAAIGRRVLTELDGVPLAAVEMLRDAAGDLWVIDVSTRAWGCFLAFAGAGADLSAAYAAVLRDRHTPATRTRPAAGQTLRVVPAALADEMDGLGLARFVRAAVGDLRPYRARLGARYCIAVLCTLVVQRWDEARPEPERAAPVHLVSLEATD